MNVTINTDASYNYEYKTGAYAYWITSNLGRLRYANLFKGEVCDNSQAELKAIANALHALTQSGWEGITHVVINCDNISSLEMLAKNQVPKKSTTMVALQKCFEFLAILDTRRNKRTPFISLRHVRAHRTINNARTWVNDWCDHQAKILVRQAVKKLRADEKKTL